MNGIRRICRSWGQVLDSRRGILGFNLGWLFFCDIVGGRSDIEGGWSSIFFISHTNCYSATVLATWSHPVRSAIAVTRQYISTSSVFQQGASFLTRHSNGDVKFFLSFCGLLVVFKDVISCPNCTGHFSQVFNLGNDVWHNRARTEPFSKHLLGKEVTNLQNFLIRDLSTTKALDYFRCILFLLLRICAAFLYYFEDTRLCSKTTTFRTLLLERMLASGLKSKPAIISSPLTFCPTATILVHYVTYSDYVGQNLVL